MANPGAVGGYQPDPLMAIFRGPARRLLARAYERPGAWAATRLPNPAPRHYGQAARRGLDPLLGPDPVPSGTARTRWMRGFVRTLNYEHKWYSEAVGGGWRSEYDRRTAPRGGLKVEVGRGFRFGEKPGRAVRVRLETGADAYVRSSVPSSERYTESEEARAQPEWRDY